MARARNIKPGFFENEDLAELPVEARLLFIGLWTLADREGRLEDRPKRIKMQLLPMDDVDADALLQQLHDAGFIERYGASTRQARCKHQCQYIQILTFEKHQSPHCKEKASTIPAPDKHGASTVQAKKRSCDAPPDSLIPDSLIPDSKPNGLDGKPSLEERLWGEGLQTLSRMAGRKEQAMRGVIGKWRKSYGDRETLEAIIRAEREAVSDPVSWITAALKPKGVGHDRFRGAL